MKKALESILIKMAHLILEGEELDKMIIDKLRKVCISENIVFGGLYLPDILHKIYKLDSDADFNELWHYYDITTFAKHNQSPDHAPTKRIFVDRNDPENMIQFEIIVFKMLII